MARRADFSHHGLGAAGQLAEKDRTWRGHQPQPDEAEARWRGPGQGCRSADLSGRRPTGDIELGEKDPPRPPDGPRARSPARHRSGRRPRSFWPGAGRGRRGRSERCRRPDRSGRTPPASDAPPRRAEDQPAIRLGVRRARRLSGWRPGPPRASVRNSAPAVFDRPPPRRSHRGRSGPARRPGPRSVIFSGRRPRSRTGRPQKSGRLQPPADELFWRVRTPDRPPIPEKLSTVTHIGETWATFTLCNTWGRTRPHLGMEVWTTRPICGPNGAAQKLSTGCPSCPPVTGGTCPHPQPSPEQRKPGLSTQSTALTTVTGYLSEEMKKRKTGGGRSWGHLASGGGGVKTPRHDEAAPHALPLGSPGTRS